MDDRRQQAEWDSEGFWNAHLAGRTFENEEEHSFFLGYYAHLITDAHFQGFIRDEARVRAVYERIHANPAMAEKIAGLPEIFDTIKRVFGKREIFRDIIAQEEAYLRVHPDSGYLTVLGTLKHFPEYLKDFPQGAFARKIRNEMALPRQDSIESDFIFFSKEEYEGYIRSVCDEIEQRIRAKLEVAEAGDATA